MAQRSVQKDQLWDNPEPKIPFETAHLAAGQVESDIEDDMQQTLVSLEHLNVKQTQLVCFLTG